MAQDILWTVLPRAAVTWEAFFMPFQLKVFQKGLILVGLPFLLELFLAGALSVLFYQSQKEKDREVTYHRGAVLSARIIALNAEIAMYLLQATGPDDPALKKYERADKYLDRYTIEIDDIRRRCPEIRVDFKEYLQSNQKVLRIEAAKFAKIIRSGDPLSIMGARLNFSHEVVLVNSSSSEKLGNLKQQGMEQCNISREKQEKIHAAQADILRYGFWSNIILGIALAIFYSRDILKRIQVIRNNTLALAKGEPMQGQLSGSDEIALVDRAFHKMKEELDEASARERQLFLNASDVICVLNEENKFSKVNPVCSEQWGYESDALLGKSVKLLDSGNSSSSLFEKLELLKDSNEPLSFECKISRKDGRSRDMLWSAYWSENEKNTYCIAHDITEQKQAERDKALFIEMISSNLHKPLNLIAANLRRLIGKKEELAETAFSKLESTYTNVNRLVELVDELILMNEINMAKIQIKRESCSISEVLQRSVADVDALAAKRNISVKIENTDLNCELDKNKIIQVLVNLLSNAIKFSPEGSTVEIKAEEKEDTISFFVKDHGRGVPASQRELIFEKFGQSESSDAKRNAGTGLGLPICKEIVEKHEGTIGLESNEGEGSTFWFELPRTEEIANRILDDRKKKAVLPAIARGSSITTKASWASQLVSKFSRLLPKPQASNLNLSMKGLLLVGVPIICEFIIVGSLAAVLQQSEKQWARELHYRLISNAANGMMISCIGLMRMGEEITDERWKNLNEQLKDARKSRAELFRLLQNEPHSLRELDKVQKPFAFIEKKFLLARESFEKKNLVFLTFPERRELVPQMLVVENLLQHIVKNADTKADDGGALKNLQLNILAWGLLSNILSSLLLAIYFSRDINIRLMLLADNANRLAHDRELNPVLEGKDELAQLDTVFHSTAILLSEARKKERAVFDNSQDIVCVLNTEGRFLSINSACEKSWGYTKEELLSDKTLLDITSKNDQSRTSKALAELDKNTKHFSFVNQVIKSNGALVFEEWSCSRKEGEPTLYCIAHDITARKELESLKQEFLAMVSHDLRSPLTAIYGTTQLAGSGAFGTVPEQARETLREINRQCRALVELISDLLDLEKLDAGKLNMDMEEIELADVLNKSISVSTLKEQVKLSYTPELDETVVKADLERLTQAVTNVINYAAANSQNGVKVRLNNKDGWSEVQIFDSAPVLAEAQLRMLFSRQKGDYGSDVASGLSLELAGKIIEKHGGNVQVFAQDKGNLFSLRLPIDIESVEG